MNKSFPSIFPVTCHTQHVGPGSTFFALQGANSHGEIFIEEAIARGAIKIVIDIPYLKKLPENIQIEEVKNGHQELARHAAKALNFPAQKLTIIGITGTKGKTSTAFLLFHLLQNAGFKTGLISTVENRIGTEFVQKSSMTTPTADFLQMFCAQAVKENVTHLVLEISAHALSYEKIEQIPLSIIIFTNFGQDHLDFYQTMEAYFLAKLKIFSYLLPHGTIILNEDDEKTSNILAYLKEQKSTAHIITTGQNNDSSTSFSILKSTFEESTIAIDKQHFSIPHFFGAHNCQNLAMTIHAASLLGISNTSIQQHLLSFTGIPGRLQAIPLIKNQVAFVDYAHNPSSMESVLKTLAPWTKQLVLVFGCGGNKDRLKRPIMGKIASQFGTTIILTDDNPRNENPKEIIAEIISGISKENQSKIVIIPDRKKAIKKGLALLRPHGFLVVLGKGHETEQIIGENRYPFNDFQIIKELS